VPDGPDAGEIVTPSAAAPPDDILGSLSARDAEPEDLNPAVPPAADGEAGLRLSVVVPTYQRLKGLPAFVEAVLGDPAASELVVAVDGSTDGSLEWLNERARHEPRLVVLDLPNRGVAAARHAAIEAAKGEVVLLLDDDVIAGPGLASGHLRHHRRGERELVLGYMPNEWQHLPPGLRGVAYLYRRDYELQCSRYEHDRDFVMCALWGGNLSLNRTDFLAHPFSALGVTRGLEDREFGVRCFKDGIRGTFDRQLLARHDFSRTIAQYRRDCRMGGRSRRELWRLHSDVLGADIGLGRAVPGPFKRIFPLLGREPLFAATAGALALLFRAAVATRAFRVEVFSARALGGLETQRGVRESDRDARG
jgi:glycosyltransferase involved in cell wall biosynthesis